MNEASLIFESLRLGGDARSAHSGNHFEKGRFLQMRFSLTSMVVATAGAKTTLALAGLGLAAMAFLTPASANCVQAIGGPNATWNVSFVNHCPYNVVVSWSCNMGNCRGGGCATGMIRPGGYDNAYFPVGATCTFSHRRW